MRNLIYFPLDRLSMYDPYLRSPDYVYNKWWSTLGVDHFPTMIQSRVHKIDAPWDIGPTVCPLPSLDHNELNFDRVIESVAEKFINLTNSTGRQPYVCWSGGIDSTSILVSLLRVADQEWLSKLTVLLDPVLSVNENSYFYSRFIKDNLTHIDINQFTIDSSNYNKILLVDGEAGNQCMGMASIHKLAYKGQFDLLNKQYKDVKISEILSTQTSSSQFHSNENALAFVHELVEQSIPFCPVPIETVYDYLWWINFNMKFDDVLLRKILQYTKYINQAELKDFFKNTLYRFYAQPELQIWSMLSKDLRREYTVQDPKYFSKKYIYNFDKNDLYWSNKREEKSSSRLYTAYLADIVAIDTDWRRYSLKDPAVRQQLGQILKRT